MRDRRHRPLPSERRRRAGGFTLIEFTIAVALAGTVAGSAVLLMSSTSRAYGTATTSREVSTSGARGIDAVAVALRQSSLDQLDPPGVVAPLSVSQIEFRRAIGLAGTVADWGDLERIALEPDPSDPVDGVDNDGDGFADEGQLVHRVRPGAADETTVVLCKNVLRNLDGEVPGNLLDDNGNTLDDEAGFAVDLDGTRVNVRLSVGRMDPEGQPIVQTFEQSIAFRNYGS